MGVLSSTIVLKNQMTGVLNNIVDSMNMVVSAAYDIEAANNKAFDPSVLNGARDKLRETQASIQEAAEEQEKFNKKLEKGSDVASKLGGYIKKALVAYASTRGVKAFVGLSDEMTQIKARLDAINDGQQETEELQEMIFQSAQRARGEYKMTMDIVTKLGAQAKAAFNSNQETIAFAENLNKLFTISGTSAQGVESVMYNLTQAMASGVLRGQDLNAVMANTPQIIEMIADYMDVPIGQIRKLAEEGQLSANVVKNALLSTKASEKIKEDFENMPMTFGQIGIQMKNKFIKSIEPALNRLNEFANSDSFKVFSDRAIAAIGTIANAIVTVVNVAVDFGNLIADNWGIVEPVIWALVTAFSALELSTMLLKIKTMELNTAFLTSPIFWIGAVVGIIIALYLRWARSVGGVKVAHQIVINAILNGLARFHIGTKKVINAAIAQWNKFRIGIIRVKNGVITALDSMRVKGLTIIQNFVNGAISMINKLISLVNNIPGVSIEAIEQVSFAAEAGVQAERDKQERDALLQDQIDQSERNQNIRDQEVKSLELKYNEEKKAREQEISKLKADSLSKSAEAGNTIQNFETPAYADMPDLAKDVKAGKDAAKGTKENTEKLKDGIEVKNEDITHLKELAEQRAIQNFSFDKIEVVANNQFGDIHETADLDGWMDTLTDNLSETVNATMGGVIAYE